MYASGNVSGNTGVNANAASNHAIYTVPAVTTQDACTAAALVLANAGPQPRNATDLAYINGVTLPNCTGAQNQPPVANAGNDISLAFPIILTTLNGSATDPDGTIASYSWSRVSGPTTFTLANVTSAITALTGLVQGTYVFRLTVTDNKGATDTDDMTVIVSGAPQPPVANAGSNITLTLPVNSTTLTGSGSDPDGTISGYAWSRVSGPTTFTFGTANASTTALTGLVQGTYVFRLTVTDNSGTTGTDDITVIVNPPVNQVPTANAGNNITLTLPINSATLTGSGTDADGTISSYAWTRVSGPTTFTLGTANTASTTLTGLVQGTYVFRLTVTDNSGSTGTDDINVTVNAAPNQAPTANAGNNIVLTLPTNSTTLTGSGADADGTIASYAWTRVSGPTTFTFGTANAATTTLTGLVQGTYVFRLTVRDNSGATGTDDVNVTVNAAPNQPPTANAGNNITLTLPANSTTLTGSGADANGTIASYAWTSVSGPTTFTFGSAGAATTTLTGLVQGTYVFRLTVTDNNGATGTDDVTVTVNAAANLAPIANAGNNIILTLPTNSTTLTGSGTDANGTISNYAWTRVSGPTTFTFGSAGAATTTLTGLVQGTYVFRLTVTDNNGATGTDDVTVTVNASAPVNQAPIANAGNNIILTLPANSTTLTGSGTDADGTISSYAWTRISGPTTFTFGTTNAATTTLTGLVQGIYVFRLTVTDNSGATGTDDVTVTVNAAANQLPVANSGNNIILTLPTNSTTLAGSGTDADGTISSYAWTRVSGPTTFTFGSAGAATTALTGLVQGTYVFRLTVTDNSGATGTDDVTVTVNAAAPSNQAPIANAGANIVINLPVNSTSLNGSNSLDLDGTITGYAWSRVSGPTTFTFGNANAATTTLSNLVQGTYVFRLTVTDNGGATDIDNIVVTVNAIANQVPGANAGNNIVITLPVNSTTLTGSGSDLDGTITGYAWSRVSGPTNFAFGNAASATTTLTNLVQGTYTFRLTVTDNSGATATDDVNVTVNPAVVPNQAPVARAGNDIVITLPVNYTTLNGNTSTDPDGVIVSYSWSRVSGPAAFTFSSAGSIATGLNNLVQGIYVFGLTVTDNSGVTSSDNITVTVNAAVPVAVNQAPIARIGNDILLTLPVNSISLSGATSTDADGSIVTYEWTQLSGPSTAMIGNRLSVSSPVAGLTIGEYRFSLKVTDNNGASSTATVKVIVSDKSGDGISLNLYPNPASANLTVRYADAANGKLRLSVYDATRKLVKDEMADKTQVTFTKTIDVSILETGTYILQVVLPDGKTVAKQFVKM
ncbi:MAG: T9SS type A sorting domain-containing protein [Bacteroidota bacterium]